MFVRQNEYKERDQATLYLMKWFVFAIMGSLVTAGLLMIIRQLSVRGLSAQSLSEVGQLIKTWFSNWNGFASMFVKYCKMMAKSPETLDRMLPYLPAIVPVVMFTYALIANPYEFMLKTFGSGRLATYRDIVKMKLFKGFVIVLGKFRGKLLMLPETLSALVVAPPGTGKTVAVVIPTILESPKMSIIVNDPKPELCFKTSGYRATQGPVFVINWGCLDEPDKGIYYPSWNPLSPRCIPADENERGLYIDSMVKVLIAEPTGSADPHWTNKGRDALSGFLWFITNKCERARANDYFVSRLLDNALDEEDVRVLTSYYSNMTSSPEAQMALDSLRKGELTSDNYVPIGTWAGLPQEWYGSEPCIAMINDWLNDAQMTIAADLKRRADEGDQSAMYADSMRDVLEYAVNECMQYNYSHRAVIELNQLAATPDKERGSILSTALGGINVFKNASVIARTRFSDLAFRDLRGMRDPITGELKPIAVYLSIDTVKARALNSITGVFVELMSSFLIANPPNFLGADGQKTGPYPVLFVLDEFPQMPKLAAVKDGPAVGRGQKVSYLLIGQDLGQISGQYGKDDLETIITTTAAKVILAQNNEQTAERFSKMIGSKTIQNASVSAQEAIFGFNVKMSNNVTRSLQSKNVVGPDSMMSLDSKHQYVLMQGFLNRPIYADSPRWFLDKKMSKKCSLPPSPFVPAWIVAQREDTEVEKLAAALTQEVGASEEG